MTKVYEGTLYEVITEINERIGVYGYLSEFYDAIVLAIAHAEKVKDEYRVVILYGELGDIKGVSVETFMDNKTYYYDMRLFH